MATKSILKDINIRDRHSTRKLIDALEGSKSKKVKEIKMTKTVKDVPKDKIKAIFGA